MRFNRSGHCPALLGFLGGDGHWSWWVVGQRQGGSLVLATFAPSLRGGLAVSLPDHGAGLVAWPQGSMSDSSRCAQKCCPFLSQESQRVPLPAFVPACPMLFQVDRSSQSGPSALLLSPGPRPLCALGLPRWALFPAPPPWSRLPLLLLRSLWWPPTQGPQDQLHLQVW